MSKTIGDQLAASSLGDPEALAVRAEADPEVVKRVLARADELDRQAKKRAPLTYLSFVGEEGNRGVLILDGALEPAAACKQAWRLKLNPGGQVLSYVIPADFSRRDYDRCYENRNRLLRPDEARELLEAKPIRELEMEGKL